MTGIAIYSPYKTFPEQLLKRTDIPLDVRYERGENGAPRYIIKVRAVQITLNLMPESEIPDHLNTTALV